MQCMMLLPTTTISLFLIWATPTFAKALRHPRTVEFRAEDIAAVNDPQRQRRLLQQKRQLEDGEEEDSGPTDDVYKVQPFVEGISEYDEYQQAWRLLGFMIDCNDPTGYYVDDDGDGSGSWDGGTGEGCIRYVLWAAYVDLNYQGSGIGEYQYWDRWSQKWDDTSCYYGDGGGGGGDNNNNNGKSRCAKMDCHLENTHWSLLGFFKHSSYDDWMEQLFKHEGICVWSEEEYAFMKNARQSWPQGCSMSSTTTTKGDPIYYDVKPVRGGGITLGLYTDPSCVKEYKRRGWNDPITVENVLGNFIIAADASGSGDQQNYDFSGYSLEEAQNMWDSAFNVFKTCQPCIAYDIYNYGYNVDDDASRGPNYGMYSNDDDANDDGNNNGGGWNDFDCYDDADYTNVNQCMKFMAKTTMNTATFRDMSLARMQGTLVDAPLAGYLDRGSRKSFYIRQGFGSFVTYISFLASIVVCVYGSLYFRKIRRQMANPSAKEPLVSDENQQTSRR